MKTNIIINNESSNVAAATCNNDHHGEFDATFLGGFACVDSKLFGYLDAVHYVPFGANGETIPTYGFVYSMPNGTWGAMLVEVERIQPLFSRSECDAARKATVIYINSERKSLLGRLAMRYEIDDPERLQAMLNHLDDIEHAI